MARKPAPTAVLSWCERCRKVMYYRTPRPNDVVHVRCPGCGAYRDVAGHGHGGLTGELMATQAAFSTPKPRRRRAKS